MAGIKGFTKFIEKMPILATPLDTLAAPFARPLVNPGTAASSWPFFWGNDWDSGKLTVYQLCQ